MSKKNEKSDEQLPFPETIFVAHYDHSSSESISLSACLSEKEAIEVGDSQPVMVADYKLVRVRKLSFAVREHE